MAEPEKTTVRTRVQPGCPSNLSRLKLGVEKEREIAKKCRDSAAIDPKSRIVTGTSLAGQSIYSLAERIRLGAATHYKHPPPSRSDLVKDLKAAFPNLGDRAFKSTDVVKLSALPSLKIYAQTTQLTKPNKVTSLSEYSAENLAEKQATTPIDPTKNEILKGKDLSLQTVYSISRRLSAWLETKEIDISHFEIQRDIQKYCLKGKELTGESKINLREIPYIASYLQQFERAHSAPRKQTLSQPKSPTRDEARAAVSSVRTAPKMAGPLDQSKAREEVGVISSLSSAYKKFITPGLREPFQIQESKHTFIAQDDVAKLANLTVNQLGPKFGLSEADQFILKSILVKLAKKESTLRPFVVNGNRIDAGLCQLNPATAKGLLLQYGKLFASTMNEQSPFRTIKYYGEDHVHLDPKMGIRFDPEANMKLAALYLISMKSALAAKDKSKGTWVNTLQVYRHGPAVVQKHFDGGTKSSYDIKTKRGIVHIKWEGGYAKTLLDFDIKDAHSHFNNKNTDPTKVTFSGLYLVEPKVAEKPKMNAVAERNVKQAKGG